MSEDAHRPLAGVRVIALEQYLSAPYCTLLLADAGATRHTRAPRC